jgi:hypothetical protein
MKVVKRFDHTANSTHTISRSETFLMAATALLRRI